MTSLPAKLSLRPEVVGIGISVANVAVADGAEELSLALDVLRKDVAIFKDGLREVFGQFNNFENDMDKADGQGLRDILSHLHACELLYSGISVVLTKMFNNIESKSDVDVVRRDFLLGDAPSLVEVLDSVHIPIIRRARLSAIVLIFRRARERGIKDAELDAGFTEWFLGASREETEAWQETAHLLAVPESADRLLRSIHVSAQDRTDEIAGLSG